MLGWRSWHYDDHLIIILIAGIVLLLLYNYLY